MVFAKTADGGRWSHLGVGVLGEARVEDGIGDLRCGRRGVGARSERVRNGRWMRRMCVVVAVSGRELRSPRFPSEAGSAEKNSFAVCRGDGGGRPETGRRGAYLVRELVGVTLVDRLGGEEEGGTVLGSHRS